MVSSRARWRGILRRVRSASSRPHSDHDRSVNSKTIMGKAGVRPLGVLIKTKDPLENTISFVVSVKECAFQIISISSVSYLFLFTSLCKRAP